MNAGHRQLSFYPSLAADRQTEWALAAVVGVMMAADSETDREGIRSAARSLNG